MNNPSNRQFIVGIIFLFIALIYSIRLFYVQVINVEYKLNSDNNVLREITQYPARGLIYDRNGDLLVYNEAAYDLMVVPKLVLEMDTNSFCNLLEISKTEFVSKFLLFHMLVSKNNYFDTLVFLFKQELYENILKIMRHTY